MSNKKILVLPGDGIGNEVMHEVLNIIDWLSKTRSMSFDISERLVGGTAYDKEGDSISDETMQEALDSDAVLFGAVGGPKWDDVEREKRPEAALLRLRKELDLFANLRPAVVFDALADSSPLKLNIVKGLDILILRELTSGVYFGQPRGISKVNDSEEKAIDTQSYTTSEVSRITRVAFDLARLRNNKVTSVEKSNVMETGMFWKKIVSHLHQNEFQDVELHHMLADNCAMQLVRNPKQFDVILTDNLFGDLLSDIAAMLTGSLGMLPSASLGPLSENGSRSAMYEPVHGSAPDIAGEGKANPLAMIMSFAMMLKYSFNMIEDSNLIEKAVQSVLSLGLRTSDISDGANKVDSQTLEELESVLISADISLDVVEKLINSVRKVKASEQDITNVVLETLAKEIEVILQPKEREIFVENDQTPKILIFVGVNGSGKTTTIGKIVSQIRDENKILIAACDTFRAAAIDQLKSWADKSKSDFFSGNINQDPASVAFQATEKFNKEGFDYLIIDTAGRLSNNTNLVNQLIKLKNVVSKINDKTKIETILVLDGTNGSNMIKQVDIFGKELDVTSIIITKLDGTAKGGALISIANKYEIPISYIGLGEKPEDLISFSAKNFSRSILNLEA